MKFLYVLRGGPASGKGVIAPDIAKMLPKPVALIEQDMFRWNIHLVGREVPEVSQEEHALAYRSMLLVLEEYLKFAQHTIVLEGLFTWDDSKSPQGNMIQIRELAEKYGYQLKSVVLKADKGELWHRNEQREYSVPREEFEALHNKTYETIDPSETAIDSTAQTTDQTLNTLRSALKLE
ncbi:MAG: AAA family ATPase [Candidatus Saccharimonadales bacterium]|nr:AAA family ATPase [Candidatus Saccharimonadales bacterium]